MTKQRTLFISFGGHQVAVSSNCDKLSAGVERGFREMLVEKPTKIVGRLEVCKKNSKYYLLESKETSLKSFSLKDILCILKYEVVVRLIQSRPDLLWFHAGAVAYNGKAMIFPAPGGRGKSTLVTSLCSSGWNYVAEDVVPIELSSGKVFPFPQTPRVREDIEQELPLDKVKYLKKTEVILKPETVCQEAMPIEILIFPTYTIHSLTRTWSVSPVSATLELLQNCINFTDHRKGAMDYICQLVKSVPAFQMSYNNVALATEILVNLHDSVIAKNKNEQQNSIIEQF